MNGIMISNGIGMNDMGIMGMGMVLTLTAPPLMVYIVWYTIDKLYETYKQLMHFIDPSSSMIMLMLIIIIMVMLCLYVESIHM